MADPKTAVLKFTEVYLPKQSGITVGELSTSAEVFGRTKVRADDSMFTVPDPKHADTACEMLGIGRSQGQSNHGG